MRKVICVVLSSLLILSFVFFAIGYAKFLQKIFKNR